VRPRLALRLNRGGLTQALPESERVRVLSRKTARTVVGMMRDVVEKGTGGRAALPRHYSAGKTGTAQKVKNGRYSSKHYVASFMGIVPVRDPRLVIVVVLDEPTHGTHTGGAAAAPVFGEVAGFAVELLGVRGDRT
jgi:cell division protein FtsI (penicillin-binding protein 3)